jgi:ligand-binding sensor domain-containing protein
MKMSLKIIIAKIIILYVTLYPIYGGKNIELGELIIYDTSNSKIPRTYINTIATDDSGKICAGSNSSGVGIFNGKTWNVFTKEISGLPSNNINKIAFDHKNVAWIGTDSGLAKYDGTTWTVFTPHNSSMKGLEVRCIAIDHNDNIWLTDGSIGSNVLLKFNGNEWKSIAQESSLYDITPISDILIDSSNTAWIGMLPGGLLRIEGNSWKIFDKNNSIMQYNWVDELELDNQGKIWVGQSLFVSSNIFAGGLLSVTHDGENWSLNNPSQTGKSSKNIQAIACDKRGFIWVATSTGDSIGYYSISIFNKRQWLSFALGKDPFSNFISIQDISIDKFNNVWFATENGITMLKQDTLAIDSLFIKEGVGIKNNFKQPIRLPKREMAFYDLLGRKCSRQGDVFKRSNCVILGFDNIRVKKIAIVK